MKSLQKEFGQHYLVDLIGCRPEKLRDVETVKEIFLKAARESGAKIVSDSFHQFEPEGVSGVIHIAWSHFAIHTWPEENYAAFDVFTCGEMDARRAIDVLKEDLGAQEIRVQMIPRGL